MIKRPALRLAAMARQVHGPCGEGQQRRQARGGRESSRPVSAWHHVANNELMERASCHSPPEEGRLAVRLVPASMRRSLCCKPAVRSLMSVLTKMTPLTPGMCLGPRAWPHPQAAPGHRLVRPEGPFRSRCEWPPSSIEFITLRAPAPLFRVASPSACPPPYCAVSQRNWSVNSVKPSLPCTAP